MRSGRQILVRGIILVVVILFAVLGPRYIAVLRVAENWASDLLVTFLTPAVEKHPDIVILAITEETLSRLPYRSPFDRGFLAETLVLLAERKVRAVGIDILFDQPTEPAKDAAFADAARAMSVPVVVGWTDQATGLSDRQYAFQQTYLKGIRAGYSNLFKDPIDGTVRNVFSGRDEAGRFRLAFAGTLAEAVGHEAPRRMIRLAYRGSPDAETPAFPAFPVDALKVLPKEWFADKVVLIGADLPFGDRHRTPFAAGLGVAEGTLPGVIVQAHVLSQLMEGRLQKGSNLAFEILAAVVLGLVGIALTLVDVSTRLKVAAGVVVLAAFLGIALWLFLDSGLATLVVAPAMAYGAAIGLGSGYEARLQTARQRQTRDAFSKYLSPAMVEKVAADPDQLRLGGDKRDMTLLFCDVRGFTTISEQFDAVGLTALINKLLTPLTDVILEHQGTVDKYMGDCIMAFWNAPLDDADHARNGCLAGLGMRAEMAPLNERLEQEAREKGRKHIPLRVGFGLSSGECVVGNMGSDQRFDYSVLGDTVNLASRLEGQSKSYGVDIVIGASTEVQVPDLATIELDKIQVKGKTVPVRIFSLLGDAEVAQSEAFRKLKAANRAMIDAYRAQDWAAARRRLEESRALGQPFLLDGLYDLYAGRLDDCEANPPDADWDGVFVATTK